MSAPFSTDFSDNLKTYVSDPSKQLHLGYSVISFWYVAAFFLGLFFVAAAFIAMVFKKNYREGTDSKRPLVILIWVGFGLMVFGIWSSISSFYTIVSRINTNVRVNKECSLFMPESAQTAVDILASSSLLNQNVADVVEKRRQALLGSRGVSDEYGQPDARSAIVYSGVDKVRSGEAAPEKAASARPTMVPTGPFGPSGYPPGPFGPSGYPPGPYGGTSTQIPSVTGLLESIKTKSDFEKVVNGDLIKTIITRPDKTKLLEYIKGKGIQLQALDSEDLSTLKSLLV